MKNRVAYVAFVLLFCCAAKAFSADPTTAEKQAILDVDNQYIKAFNSDNAEAAAQLFTEDAVYYTDEGRTLRGREEIKRDLEEQFKTASGETLDLKVYSIDVAPDKTKATERGVSIVTANGIQEPSSYVAEYTRQGDKWLVSRVVEEAESPSAEHLKDLAWMIGAWKDQSEGATIRTKSEWALNRSFVTRKFAVSGNGLRDLKGLEYIGWDPLSKEIRSWYFDSQGGYGNGRWHHEGKTWVEQSSGVTPAGETASGTHIFTPRDENSFSWRSINRKIGNEAQEDIPEVIIYREKDEQSDAAKGEL
jgi:uncharacterized protein (TIGR02246 family)